ncbi:MAG: tetratricopeptide repeat protein [Desulfosarcina sp.]
MKRLALILLILTCIQAVPIVAAATETARTFMDGTQAYREKDWPAAIGAFEHLAQNGVNNGRLFYNLGNAYLKNGDIGRALLWYERAKKLIPDDPDLQFNYDYALTLTQDEQKQKESFLPRILFFWKYRLPPPTVRWLAIVLNAVLWSTLTVLTLRKKRRLRPTVVLIAAAALIFSATAFFNFIEAARLRDAIILPATVAVRSGFSESATQLFVLHAGTKVRVERESHDHLLIRYTEDKRGWVKKADAGMI